jgi:hypothetical protein
MPGDLRDPEQFQTWHYDPKYDATPNQFLPGGSFDIPEYLQSIAMDTLAERVGQELIDQIQSTLDEQGYMGMNPGDETFRKKVKELMLARKVTAKWLS